jgi:hypothetical protein
MKLYTITLTHYSPKDDESGIDCLLIAKDDEQVYEWLKKNRATRYSYKDEDAELYNINSAEYPWNVIKSNATFKEKTIYWRGCANDPDTDYEDLYYGQTNWSWDEGQEIAEADIQVLQQYLGDKVINARGEG